MKGFPIIIKMAHQKVHIQMCFVQDKSCEATH